MTSSVTRSLTNARRLSRPLAVSCLGLAFLLHAHAQQTSNPTAPKSPAGTAKDLVISQEDIQRMISRGSLKEAEIRLATLAQQQPEPPGVERLRGMIYYQRNELAAAAEAFAKALAQNSNDLEAAQMRGAALFRMGQTAEAIPFLERANTTIAAANVDGTYVLAASYLDVNRFDDARRVFARQYGVAEDSAASYLVLGRMLLRRNLPTESEKATRKAIQLEPGLPLAHLLLGTLDLARQRTADAIVDFEAERKINPMDGEVYERLGDSYMQAVRYEDAQQALNCAVLLEPNSTGPYILLGQVLLKRDDPLTALNYLLRAEHMDESNHFTHVLLGQAYRALGRKADSTREYENAEKIQSSTR